MSYVTGKVVTPSARYEEHAIRIVAIHMPKEEVISYYQRVDSRNPEQSVAHGKDAIRSMPYYVFLSKLGSRDGKHLIRRTSYKSPSFIKRLLAADRGSKQDLHTTGRHAA